MFDLIFDSDMGNIMGAYVVGVTGGIGCGKTTVVNLFAEKQVTIIDTDVIAHALTQPQAMGLTQIVDAFGKEILNPDGTLNRAQLRTRVFQTPAEKKQLEAILHPLIRQEVRRQYAAATSPYVLIVIPLLFETNAYPDLIQRRLVIDCAEETQIARVMQRNHMTREQVLAIMATQVSRAERQQRADDLILNEASLDALPQRVAALHELYLHYAAQSTSLTPPQ